MKKKIAAIIVAILVAVGAYFGLPEKHTRPVLETVAEVVTADEADAGAPLPADATSAAK